MTTLIPKYDQGSTGAVNRPINLKLAESLSVLDFGADPAGSADSTTAIQNAINAAAIQGASTGNGNVVYFPPGLYKISSSLNLPGSQFVSLLGAGGKVSQLVWSGANSTAMVLMNNGSSESAIFIEKLGFTLASGSSITGVIGIQTCKTAGNAVVNLSIRKNYFGNLDTALQANTETDELVFAENYVLTYASYGVAVLGGTCSNYQIRDNQFRDGSATSIGIYHAGGNNILVEGNTIQTSHQGAMGVKLSSIYSFNITSNYFEVSGTNVSSNGPFINLLSSISGVIEANYSTGDVGNYVVDVDASCQNIRFGPNTHAISGGTPAAFISIATGATNIEIDAIQTVIGGSFPIFTGNPTFVNEASFIYTEQYFAKAAGLVNISSSSSSQIFSGTSGQGYLVVADQITEGYSASSIVIFNPSGAINSFSLGQTNANFTITASGLNISLNNGITATRTCNYVVTRVF